MSFRLNEKLKIKQCSVSIANAGDQLPCLSPGGALLIITTTAKSHGINLAIKIKIIQELQFLFNWILRYMNIVLQDLTIITNFISKY